MGEIELPEGRYLTCPVDVAVDTGGQTRALLMRNRIFAQEAGIRPSVLTFGAATDLDERREKLLERGLLRPDVDLLNVYEHFRDTDWEGNKVPAAGRRELTDLSRHLKREQTFPDGSPWRRTYREPHAERDIHDFLRPDGTTFLRISGFAFQTPATWPRRVLRVSRQGEVVGEFTSLAGWFRQWLRELSEGQRTFVFMDSRYIAPLIAPMKAPNIHLIYLLHNIHVTGEQRWDSPTNPVYTRLMSLVGGFDAFVTLTDRQRSDIAQLRGRTSNLFVVPNPVDLPAEPDVPPQRDPRLVTVVARLEGQKRLSHAIEAFRHVVAEIPDARLEIYGSGSRAAGLQEAINRRGLQGSVTMMGHHPQAREALWKSSAMLMTSLFEGYPLSTLESLSHGCPVVSYDIKYGPREQITDGVDGYLVPEGDTRQMADRILTLLRDPALVRRMSRAARETAKLHGNQRFVSDWAQVVASAVELKPLRTRIADVTLTVHRLEFGGRLSQLRGGTDGAGTVRPGTRMRLAATLEVHGRNRNAELSDARVELAAVHETSGEVVDVPVEVQLTGRQLEVRVDTPLSALYPPDAEGPDQTHLRLRLLWHNSAWETAVRRPADGPPGIELSYLADNELRLVRR